MTFFVSNIPSLASSHETEDIHSHWGDLVEIICTTLALIIGIDPGRVKPLPVTSPPFLQKQLPPLDCLEDTPHDGNDSQTTASLWSSNASSGETHQPPSAISDSETDLDDFETHQIWNAFRCCFFEDESIPSSSDLSEPSGPDVGLSTVSELHPLRPNGQNLSTYIARHMAFLQSCSNNEVQAGRDSFEERLLVYEQLEKSANELIALRSIAYSYNSES